VRVDLAVSRRALAKEHVDVPALDDRMGVLRAVAGSRPGLGVVLTELQLLADIAAGYDAVILGADKWVQLHDPAFYDGSDRARDAALARLPQVVIVSRVPHEPPPAPPGAVVVELPEDIGAASSTAVRRGDRLDWMLPEARAFDERTGAWTDPVRYVRERAGTLR
jgi:hypothetical protein